MNPSSSCLGGPWISRCICLCDTRVTRVLYSSSWQYFLFHSGTLTRLLDVVDFSYKFDDFHICDCGCV